MFNFKDAKELSAMDVIDSSKYAKKLTEAFLKMKIDDIFQDYNICRQKGGCKEYDYTLFIFKDHFPDAVFISAVKAAFSEITVFEFLMLTRQYYADKSALKENKEDNAYKELAIFHVCHMFMNAGKVNPLVNLFLSLSLRSFYDYLTSLKENPFIDEEKRWFYTNLREIPEFEDSNFGEVPLSSVIKQLLDKTNSCWYPWNDYDSYKSNIIQYHKLCEKLFFDSFYCSMKHRYSNKSCSIKLHKSYNEAEEMFYY